MIKRVRFSFTGYKIYESKMLQGTLRRLNPLSLRVATSTVRLRQTALKGTIIHTRTKTDSIMARLPRYVVDSPLGGRVDLGNLVGSESTGTENATEDYWPRIPPSYGPPPAHLEDAVKEVGYICLLLSKTTAPDNGTGDVSCISKLLASLETRHDITKLVLEYTEYERALRHLEDFVKDTPEIDTLNIGPRATALKQHWANIRAQDESSGPQDVAYPPLLWPAPNAMSLKVEFTAKGKEEAKKYYRALKTEREYYYRCFQASPPMPMGWAPKDEDAWAKTARDKVESGDLFHSRHWTPLWEGFGLASIGVMIGMETAVMTPAELDEYHGARDAMNDMSASFQGRGLEREGLLAN
ncbi:hypothetical protein KVR01_011759 [Diaporthe batatas]|uniref:uncharacterized protein n=1 Tax=Diaporthe batatas TaxID=748121 RepID=UPI001D0453DF|nr:uncharacterized protein KVR01_011759 [Diaporthe batatas]KAG8158637.1 hypothetical protein KVR01_011759 [Diaporthe batatas]